MTKIQEPCGADGRAVKFCELNHGKNGEFTAKKDGFCQAIEDSTITHGDSGMEKNDMTMLIVIQA